MRPGPRRTPLQRKMQREEMCQLIVQGWQQVDIARKYGVSKSTISTDYNSIIAEMEEDRKKARDKMVGLRISQYNHVLRNAWDEWDKSGACPEGVTEALDSVRTLLEEAGTLTADVAMALATVAQEAAGTGEKSDKWLKIVLSTLDSMVDLEGVAEPKRKEPAIGVGGAEDAERLLEALLPVVRDAMAQVQAARAAEAAKSKGLADAPQQLPSVAPGVGPTLLEGPTVVQVPDAVPYAGSAPAGDVPDAEEFDLEAWLRDHPRTEPGG